MNWNEIAISAVIGAVLVGVVSLLKKNGKIGKFSGVMLVATPIIIGNFVYYKYINQNIDRAEVEYSIEKFAVYQTIKQQDPTLYTNLVNRLVALKSGGSSEQEIIDEIKQSVALLTVSKIQSAPDKSVVEYMSVILDELHFYQENDKTHQLCYKALYPQVEGGVNTVKELPATLVQRDLEALNNLFTASTGKPIKPENEQYRGQLEAIVQELHQKYGDDLLMLSNPTAANVDRKKVCDMAVELYGNVLRLPQKEAGTIIRTMLAGEQN
ncbi:DNA gyrase [Yersinia nurmii]|uniref:DNA gyrase n=1 Tax=Yersinia nurmii TaxID=685706 RepID=A0AAW7K1H8_9GAMM|nr:DNA gyrase [Yersinia nurmii]MDN0089168.1 DNA gyrase [Yersinia nurmii]